MQTLFYIIVFLLFLLLFVLSRRERLYTDRTVSAVIRPFRKSAVWIYRQYWNMRIRRRQSGRLLPSEERVRKDIRLLDSSGRVRRKEALYYIGKLQNLLLFLAAADFIAFASSWSSGKSGQISDAGVVQRPGYEAPDKEVRAIASAESGNTSQELGVFSVEIGAQSYTKEETDAMAEKLSGILPDRILGDNKSLLHVTKDLDLVTKVDGYPFRIRWKSSRYEYIDESGTVASDMLAGQASQKVSLTAVMTYLDRSYEKEFEIIVFPEEKSASEILETDIRNALANSNQATSSGKYFYLPESVDGVALSWSEETENRSFLLFIVISAAGIMSFVMMDGDLHRKVQDREKQMALDYPQVVSKMILLVGAGMSVRSAFVQIGLDYRTAKEKGGEPRYVYEEILLLCRELESGVTEGIAVARFGKRCCSRHYSKFCSILTQNQKKGNSRLLEALKEEADLAFTERKGLARQLGEEAGTKLIFPMVMMLGVTLAVIMIPAFYSFSL